MTMRRTFPPYVLAILLVLVMAGHIPFLDQMLDLTTDEVWSATQANGTWQEVYQWTPYDWAVGYYLILSGWERLVGLHPIMLRTLSLLVYALGLSAFYRAIQRLHTPATAVLAVLVYGSLGWGVFASLLLRGHSFTLALAPIPFWLTLRHLERPSWKRGLLLAMSLAGLVYIHSTVVIYFIMLGLFTLLIYPMRYVTRWVYPTLLMLILSSPEIIHKFNLTTQRVQATRQQQIGAWWEAIPNYYAEWFGRWHEFWWIILVVGVAMMAVAPRTRARLRLGWLVWLLMPVVLYLANPLLGFYHPRYTGWVSIGLAGGLAVGLVRLPRVGQWAVGLCMLGMLYSPLALYDYDAFSPYVGETFAWLAERLHWGDAVIVDPQYRQTVRADQDEWDYFTQVFFPQHDLTFTDALTARRVWYISEVDFEEPSLYAQLKADYIPREFFGYADFFTRLYEAPPNRVGVPFESGLLFHGADLVRDGQLVDRFSSWHEGEQFTLRLWWSIERIQFKDYSMGIYVTDGLHTVLEEHTAPLTVSYYPEESTPPSSTSWWQLGRYYVEERAFTLPANLLSGLYTVKMSVYHWEDGVLLDAPHVDENGLLPIASFGVRAW